MNAFVIFIPIDKWGNDVLSRKCIIYDTGYLVSIDRFRINKQWLYKIVRYFNQNTKTPTITYLNCKTYRFTFGVVSK